MREHRRWNEKGCTHHGMLIPLFLPTPTHRESHGDILNFYSHPTNGMKISPTEVLWRKLGGEKKKERKEKERGAQMCVKGGPQRKPPLMGWDRNVTEEANL